MLLTGAPGCGKTMLVQNVSRRLPDAGIQVFTIATPRANSHSLLLQIFAALGLDVPADADTAQLLRTLQKYLLGEVQANRRLLLVRASSWGWEGRPRLARLHAYFDSPFSSFSVEQFRWGCSSHIDGSDA